MRHVVAMRLCALLMLVLASTFSAPAPTTAAPQTFTVFKTVLSTFRGRPFVWIPLLMR